MADRREPEVRAFPPYGPTTATTRRPLRPGLRSCFTVPAAQGKPAGLRHLAGFGQLADTQRVEPAEDSDQVGAVDDEQLTDLFVQELLGGFEDGGVG